MTGWLAGDPPAAGTVSSTNQRAVGQYCGGDCCLTSVVSKAYDLDSGRKLESYNSSGVSYTTQLQVKHKKTKVDDSSLGQRATDTRHALR